MRQSKTLDVVGAFLILIGFGGFFVCWVVGWNSEQQVLGRAELRQPSGKRTAPIEMKGVTWYVEPAFARRYNTADYFIGGFWLLGVAGGAIRERKRIITWWRSRRTDP